MIFQTLFYVIVCKYSYLDELVYNTRTRDIIHFLIYFLLGIMYEANSFVCFIIMEKSQVAKKCKKLNEKKNFITKYVVDGI